MEILVTIGYILLCVLLFSIAIAIHEWGHFIVALKLGLKVERFSIGFGPAIWKKKVNGVEYRLSWIPLGGYVSIPDVDPEGTKKLEGGGKDAKPRVRIPAWKELAVAFAGPFMNVVLAVALAFLLACVPAARFGEGLPVVDDLEEIGPAARAGLRNGDRILSIDGQPVASWYDLLVEVQLAGGHPVTLVAVRESVTNTYEVTPVKEKEFWSLGADAALTTDVGAVMPDSPAERAGVKPGDALVSYAGHDLAIWSDFEKAVDAAGAAGGELVVRRGATNVTLGAMQPKASYCYEYVGPFAQPAVVGRVNPGTVAARAGLKPGDRIVSLAGAPVASWEELVAAIQKTKGADAAVTVVRGDETLELHLAPRKGASGKYFIQAYADPASTPATPAVTPGSPAAAAGFVAGDTVVSVNGKRVGNWLEMSNAVHREGSSGRPLKIGVRRGTETVTIDVTARPVLRAQAYFCGAAPVKCASWMTHRGPVRQMLDDGKGIFHILKALVTPKKAAATGKALGGPVMIAQGIYVSIRHDFWSGLGFLRFLNVNLAIVNLLPIPVLDGGLILFSLIAIVFRRRVPDKIVGALSMGFMYLLLALMALLIWRDSARIVRKQMRNTDTISYVTTDHELEKTDTVPQDR